VEHKVEPRIKHERFRLDISYALRADAIAEKNFNAFDHGFTVGTYEFNSTADLVCNLTPDKQHTAVITAIMPLMKRFLSIFSRF
jgi:ketol-acid reductoisomerase